METPTERERHLTVERGAEGLCLRKRCEFNGQSNGDEPSWRELSLPKSSAVRPVIGAKASLGLSRERREGFRGPSDVMEHLEGSECSNEWRTNESENRRMEVSAMCLGPCDWVIGAEMAHEGQYEAFK